MTERKRGKVRMQAASPGLKPQLGVWESSSSATMPPAGPRPCNFNKLLFNLWGLCTHWAISQCLEDSLEVSRVLELGCYSNLMCGTQGCFSASCNSHNDNLTKNDLDLIIHRAKLEKLCFKLNVLHVVIDKMYCKWSQNSLVWVPHLLSYI